jgi:hypothetical protein
MDGTDTMGPWETLHSGTSEGFEGKITAETTSCTPASPPGVLSCFDMQDVLGPTVLI